MSGVGDALHQCVRQACLLWYDEVGTAVVWHGVVFCDMASLSERQNLGKFPPRRFGRTDMADTIPLKRNVWNVLSKNVILWISNEQTLEKGYHGRLWASEVGQIFLHHLDVYPKLISTDILIHHTHSIYSKFPLANILNWSRQLSYLHIQEREKYE